VNHWLRKSRILGGPLPVRAFSLGDVVLGHTTANAGSVTTLEKIQSELHASTLLKSLPIHVNPLTREWTDLLTRDYGAVATGGWNSTCWDESQSSSSLPTCVYGDQSAKRTLLLTGDSQAWMWEPAFDKWRQSSGWKVIVLTKGACQPWPDSQQEFVNDSAFPACRTFQTNVVRYVKATYPSVVVAAGLVPVVPRTSISRVETDESEFVTSITTSGAGILIVHPSPSFYAYNYTARSTLSTPTCLARHAQQMHVCNDISKGLIMNYYMSVVLNENTLLGKSRLLKLSQLLCNSKCPMIADGTLVYIDSDHVSYDWAIHVSSALGEILAPYLKGL